MSQSSEDEFDKNFGEHGENSGDFDGNFGDLDDEKSLGLELFSVISFREWQYTRSRGVYEPC